MDTISTGKDSKVFAFARVKDDNKVVVFLNLRKKDVKIKPALESYSGEYTEYFTGTKVSLPLMDSLKLEPYGYRVFIK